MASKSTTEADWVLNGTYRTAAAGRFANTYVGFYAGDPLAGGVEIASTGGYARTAVATADAQWTAPASVGLERMIANVNAINFATASADWNGGVAITHWSTHDASTAGNRLHSGPLGVSRIVHSGDPVTIAAGAIAIYES